MARTSPRPRPRPGRPAPVPGTVVEALYLHLPFCVVKCGYCDFTSYAGTDEDLVDRVLDAWVQELRMVAPRCRPRTLFLGGGTPTHLTAARLEAVLAAIRAEVALDDCAEWTTEANPESASADKLRLLREAGVTRLSLGVQAFDDERLAFLDRPHDSREARAAFERATAAGFGSTSLDLIFGTPGHEPAAWAGELDQALALGPDHVSAYGLTFEAGTRLTEARDRGLVQELDEERAATLFLTTRDKLQAAGLRPYELSNFARPGSECRHNLNYWRGGDYLGVGPGAASHVAGRRWTNLRSLEPYVGSIQAQGSAAGEAETLDPAHRIREAVWLGLRTLEGVDLEALGQRIGLDPADLCREAIEAGEKAGELERDGTRIRISENSWLHADRISGRFL
ncbi:MAG: radical SAM family heme chaperone HemW [Planctomycetota bacterium]